ncbi:MAG: alpha-ketoacid dehydrogenase subunit beta [Chthonomonadales bacterium]|nr:alpha-ketoacid dehydrogenase subunit beta [Chthonomonadales bacterium]
MHQTTYLGAIREGIAEEMRREERVFVLGEDVGVYGGAFKVTDGFHDEFGPERVIDMPIAESAIVGVSIGAALMGMRPVAEMQFMDFISCGFDQIVNEAATYRYRYGGACSVPMVVRGPSGGNIHGGLFHSQSREAWFTQVAGLKVVMPATAYDAKGLIKAAIRDNNPVIFFEHKYLYRRVKENIPDEEYIVPLGKARVASAGTDITVVTWGAMVSLCQAAAELLEEDDIDLEVIDIRTMVPLDTETILESVRKTNRVMVVHEASRTGGFGGEIAAILAEQAFDSLDAPIVRIASADTHVPFSPPLERFYLPSVTDVVEAARKLARY